MSFIAFFGDQKTKDLLPQSWESFRAGKCTHVYYQLQPVDSLVEDIIPNIFTFLDIPDVRALLSVSKKFARSLSEQYFRDLVWKPIAQELGCPLDASLPADQQVMTFIANLKKNIVEIQGELKCAELPALLKSNKIEDLLKLQKIRKARDTHMVHTALARKIGQADVVSLNSFNTIEDLLSIPDKFTEWCNTHNATLAQVTSLDLSDKKLISLPTEIGKLTNLQNLYLDGNNLTSLPVEIGNLTNLLVLSLQNNNLTSLPAEIGKLTNLSFVLSLKNNNLTSVPAEIGNLTNLQGLYLSNNNLISLPTDIGKLTNLT